MAENEDKIDGDEEDADKADRGSFIVPVPDSMHSGEEERFSAAKAESCPFDSRKEAIDSASTRAKTSSSSSSSRCFTGPESFSESSRTRVTSSSFSGRCDPAEAVIALWGTESCTAKSLGGSFGGPLSVIEAIPDKGACICGLGGSTGLV